MTFNLTPQKISGSASCQNLENVLNNLKQATMQIFKYLSSGLFREAERPSEYIKLLQSAEGQSTQNAEACCALCIGNEKIDWMI